MIASNISVEETSWHASQQQLKHIRSILASQNGIPASQIFDVYDNKADHFLAHTTSGEPVGCCRLLESGEISRPQVLLEWQLKGVENKLIEQAVKFAKRETKLEKLFILEDVRLAPYYVHFGFKAEGSPTTELGLPAQRMVYTITRQTENPHSTVYYEQPPIIQPIENITTFSDRPGYVEALKQVAGHSRRTIKIYSPLLTADIFGTLELLKIFSAHCRRSRFTDMQILVLNEKSLVSETHGLRLLYEKIPSSINIRKLVPDDDEIDFREYLVSDDGHMTIRSRSRTIEGELSSNRPSIAKFLTSFDEYWMKSKSIPDLRLTTY
jgi:predicted GNAT family N-acyltransferase